MKYLRKFKSEAEYNSFMGGGGSDYVEPHVIAIADGVSKTKMRYKKYVKPEPIENVINDGNRKDCMEATYPVESDLTIIGKAYHPRYGEQTYTITILKGNTKQENYYEDLDGGSGGPANAPEQEWTSITITPSEDSKYKYVYGGLIG